MKEARELAFNLVARNGRLPSLRSIFATLQPEGVLEPLQIECGDRLAFLSGFRTRAQVLIARKTCKGAPKASVYRLANGSPRINLGGCLLNPSEFERLAIEAGFRSAEALTCSFEKIYGLPFNGTLLRW